MLDRIRMIKGDPAHLCGRLVVFARITTPSLEADTPFADLVQGGLMAVAGDFRSQRSFRQIMSEAAGVEDFDEFIQQVREGGNVPEGLDLEGLFGKMDSMARMEIIPVPAQVLLFDSEEELLEEEADILCVGEFVGTQHAHMATTAFPILYQALFHEQQAVQVKGAIDDLLQEVERDAADGSRAKMQGAAGGMPGGSDGPLDLTGRRLSDFEGDLYGFLTREVVPALLHDYGEGAAFEATSQSVRKFLEGNPAAIEAERLIDLIPRVTQRQKRAEELVDLCCRKIDALQREDFAALRKIQKQMDELG